MKTTLLLLAMLFATIINAQSLKKYSISNSGCSLYSYCDAIFTMELSDDSSKVYTGECANGEVTYGVICVKLLTTYTDLTIAEDLLISYMDYLKTNFKITKAIGYGRGYRLNDNENTRGIMDYWEDADLDKWKVKAWTDGKFIGFMFAYSKKELPETKVNVFLDSFRLPAM